MKNTGALDGITVIDLSRLLPGPYCSMILADHGARVIAVEDRRFAADGLFIEEVNRNKAHMTLNLKHETGRDIFLRLVQRCDVVIEGFRPGVVHRLGVDYDTLRGVNPGLIYCSITGYGQNGPYRDRVGHDVNYLAVSGVLDLMGEPDRPPAIPGIQIADMAAGGMNAAIGILLALWARGTGGEGQYIDISMTDGSLGLLPLALFQQRRFGRAPMRGNALLAHRYACYNTYETADGRYLSIGALEHRFWKRLCDHLGQAELIPHQFDETRRTQITERLRAEFRSKTLAQWEKELADLDVCWAPVHCLEEALEAPLFKAREMVLETLDPRNLPTAAIGVPIKLSGTPGSVRTPAVGFGESTAAILGELGYGEADIRAFADQGVI
jgi:crotonobetainyl-CoA:carnitine CoA-transferase CaiB-like acyl-CoA transferase